MKSLKMVVKTVVWVALISLVAFLIVWSPWTKWGAIKQAPWWLMLKKLFGPDKDLGMCYAL